MALRVVSSKALAFTFGAVAFIGVAACSDLKEGTDPSDVRSPLPSGSPSSPAPSSSLPISPEGGTTVTAPPSSTGPGPRGALPNGYCCTADTDCRARSCVAGMCADTCADEDGCLDTAGPFTCEGARGEKRCVPQGAVTCVPAASFARGTKKLGECCVATHDARAGLECEGGRCDAFGPTTNPYICGQACEKAADCPGAYMCIPGPYNFKICVPEATQQYTCK